MAKQIVIAGDQLGLEKRNRAFLLPKGAYPTLFNAYERRQRIRKKRGHIARGRLRRLLTGQSLGNTDGGGAFTGDIRAILGLETNSSLEPGSISITVGAQVFTDPASDGVLVGGGGGTINYATTVVSLQTAPVLAATAVSADFNYFPCLPAVGILQQEVQAVNQEQTIAFDTVYAYIAIPTGWSEFGSTTPTTWTGADFNLFWGVNYQGTAPQIRALWVTNNIDPIRFYEGATWTSLTPALTVSMPVLRMDTALLIAPFKGRLLVFNVTQTDTMSGVQSVFVNRCRYSQSALTGPPTDAVLGWVTDKPGRGGFIDAPTAEAIVSVQNLKDRLIVYFERSTWELVYTGNETLPFYFRQINRELGSESTFSVIPFDSGVLGIGNVGIHACNGTNVTRIDEEIPDQVYKIQNENQGPDRVSGVRDFVEEVVYWTYPDYNAYTADLPASDQKFPNRVILYNYVEGTWAILEESFTIYGYLQPETDFTWDTLPYVDWDAWDVPWDGGLTQARVLKVLAGNQQGYTFEMNNDTSANAVSRAIQDFPTASSIISPDHNMQEDDYFIIAGEIGVTLTFAKAVYTTFRVTEITSADTFTFDGVATGTYLGGGEITVLSNFEIRSKEFNDFFPIAQSMRIPFVDFLFDRIPDGEISVYFYLNDTQVSANRPLQGTSTIPLGGTSLQPLQALQKTLWYRKYANAVGKFIQYQLRLSNDEDLAISSATPQMRNATIPQQDFVLNAVVLTAEPSGRLAP